MTAINPEAAAERAKKRHDTLGLYTTKEVADMFGFDERTMAIWRSKSVGPRYTKLGKAVYYKLEDITNWIDAGVVETASTICEPIPVDKEQFQLFPPDEKTNGDEPNPIVSGLDG
jgi:Helix-turn-helix domain